MLHFKRIEVILAKLSFANIKFLLRLHNLIIESLRWQQETLEVVMVTI